MVILKCRLKYTSFPFEQVSIWQFWADQSACHRTLGLTNKLLWENMTVVAHFAVKAFWTQNCLPHPMSMTELQMLATLYANILGRIRIEGRRKKIKGDDKSSPYKLCCHLSHLMVFAFVYTKVSASSTRIPYTFINPQTVFYFLFLCQYLRGDLSGFLILSDLCRFSNPILRRSFSVENCQVGVW